MKIAHVITRSDSIGGAHIHVRDLSVYLKAQGHDPKVLIGGAGPFTRELAEAGVPFWSLSKLVRPIHPIKDVAAFFELRRALAVWNPDLVATHSSKAGWLGRLAARSLGIPVVFTAHGWAFTDIIANRRRQFYITAEKWAARFSDKIITVSNYDRKLALDFGIADDRMLVPIHNGMPDVPEECRANPQKDPPRIIMVARFEAPKDYGTLLGALALLREMPWTLELVGDGPLRAEAERITTRLGMRERVAFVGEVSDVPSRLANSQVFALISESEGFPLAILEAMRAGLPVIASNVGGVCESVADGINGFLVPRGDVQSLSNALRSLLQSPALRVEMGSRGRERYETEFTFDIMFEKTLRVYREVLANR